MIVRRFELVIDSGLQGVSLPITSQTRNTSDPLQCLGNSKGISRDKRRIYGKSCRHAFLESRPFGQRYSSALQQGQDHVCLPGTKVGGCSVRSERGFGKGRKPHRNERCDMKVLQLTTRRDSGPPQQPFFETSSKRSAACLTSKTFIILDQSLMQQAYTVSSQAWAYRLLA